MKVILLLITFLAFIGCSKNNTVPDPNSIIGKWTLIESKYIKVDSLSTPYVITKGDSISSAHLSISEYKADGTLMLYSIGSPDTGYGKYKIIGDSLDWNIFPPPSPSYRFSIKEDTLTLAAYYSSNYIFSESDTTIFKRE